MTTNNDSIENQNVIYILALFFFLLITLWDTFTTAYGIGSVLGWGPVQVFIAIIFTLIIDVFVLGTFRIVKSRSDSFFKYVLYFLWAIAVIYDVYSSYLGNAEFIIKVDQGLPQIFMLIGLTIFVASSPIIVSYLVIEKKIIKINT